MTLTRTYHPPRVETSTPGRLGVLLLVAMLAQSCLGPPDTFGDMQTQLDRVIVPEDFLLVEAVANNGGLRGRFAAAPSPSVSRSFSARWDSGALCERIRSITESRGLPESTRQGNCGYRTRVPSGFTAKLVNVWSYELELFVHHPETAVNSLSEEQCEDARRVYEERGLASFYAWRDGRCWVDPDLAFVAIILHGKTGW
jgi:hypothetical protein